MKETKTYWKGLDELNKDPEFTKRAQEEFPEYLSVKDGAEDEDSGNTSRRDFLKLMGFSVAAASLAACETPTKHAIPYINKPEEIEPGKANWYATTIARNGLYGSLLVKTREGRPIFAQANPDSPVASAVNAQMTASVLGLYDNSRLKTFTKGEEVIARKDADAEIIKTLKDIDAKGGNIRIVSETILSPSTKSVIKDFAGSFEKAKVKHVVYDAVSAAGLVKANGNIPNYDFSKAQIVAGFNADFLGSWISPAEYAKAYAQNRKVSKTKKVMSKHYQFETGMTITGAAADTRVKIRPSEEPYYLIALLNELGGAVNNKFKSTLTERGLKQIKSLAKELKANKSKGLVVSGSNDEAVQLLVNKINKKIGAFGSTIDTDVPAYYKQGNDDDMLSFIEELSTGKVDAVVFYNSNPVYNHPAGAELEKALAKVELTVSFADRADETASACNYICPDYHYLESWDDAEPKKGILTLAQPTIDPIFDFAEKGYENRAAQESLLTWAGESTSYYDYIRNYWKQNYASGLSFDSFWNQSVHDGFAIVKSVATEEVVNDEDVVASPIVAAVVGDDAANVVAAVTNDTNKFNTSVSLSKAMNKIEKSYQPSSGETDTFEINIYESVNLGSGTQFNNPWLHENPDPMSKVTWGNYVAMSITDANRLELMPEGPEKNEVPLVKVTLPGNEEIVLPVLVQPGHASGAVSVALGYGRTSAGTLTKNGSADVKNPSINAGTGSIGQNAYSFVVPNNSTLSYTSAGVIIGTTGKMYQMAQTQTHHTIMGRDSVGGETIIAEATLSEFQNNETGVVHKKVTTSAGELNPNEVDMWAAPVVSKDAEGNDVYEEVKTHEYPDHHWGLIIDLNSCTGCGTCQVGCHAENNVPVVGRDEVIRRREMHWMRIDRYYSSDTEAFDADGTDNRTIGGFKKMEDPSDSPSVVFQPMMCQHCNHAPCETVCPVAATTHSHEGLNQMTYNRCIGTRYCANNCPYKVRRFNWFNYSDSADEGREFKDVNVATNTDLGKMVLNPDVVVRARGTMEKCSMCVQRIQAGKLKAKLEKRKVKDGDIETACASVCPTDSITFGDMNDKTSRIYQVLNEENADRAYNVLQELNVKPNVSYLSKITNRD